MAGELVQHVLRSPNIGGVERQARDFAAELLLRGSGGPLVVLASVPLSEEVRHWHEQALPVVEYSDRRGSMLGISRVLALRGFFRELSARILHFHYALPDGIIWSDVLAARAAGKLVVVTLHHALAWSRGSVLQTIKQKIARGCIDRVVVTTPFAKALVSERMESATPTVIPCGLPIGGGREQAKAGA